MAYLLMGSAGAKQSIELAEEFGFQHQQSLQPSPSQAGFEQH
jgi:hypothetical protein